MSNDASTDFTLTGHAGALVGRSWPLQRPRWVAVIAHGYGEHTGRYDWVAACLNGADAAVYAADHVGHGRSDGQRVLISDYEPVVEDLHLVVQHAAAQHPGLPSCSSGTRWAGSSPPDAQLHADALSRRCSPAPCSAPGARWISCWSSRRSLTDRPRHPLRDPAVGVDYAEARWCGTATSFPRSRRCRRPCAPPDGSIGEHPLLYLHGEDDRLVPLPASWMGLLELRGPRTFTKTYPGAQHEIFHETHRDEVIADVIGFVQGVLSVRG